MFEELTGQVRERLQLLFPELRDPDGLALLAQASRRHPLLVRVRHELLEVFGVESVEDVEKIFPGRPFVLGILGGEEGHEDRVLLHLGPEAAHRQLVVHRDLDSFNLGLLHELFLPREHLPQEVLGHNGFVRQIVLH